MLIKEEYTVELRVIDWIVVSVVLVIIEVQEVVGVIHATEGVVREGSPAAMNFHGSLGTCQVVINVNNIVGELDCVTENKHPGLSDVRYLGRFRIDAGVMDNHDFFSC